MKLSVIIVNYNVRAYLEQCLRTVYKALEHIEGEVFVVDNLSTDGSVEMVRDRFPRVRLMANAGNVGFSRANNQAIRESTGEYVLLLNPDTVVGEEVFRDVIQFLDPRPKVGGLGVKMIDGTGRFLPESKRGLPTPSVALCKIIGLTRLFPRNRIFGRYHLGHLPEDEAAPIEILSGACMFLRRKTLDQVGLLDESFFMYGEDIDLSYRITLGGYENWYFPRARIIHYKGESTKKSSVNYVFVFYNAMAIFARKHFARRGPQLFSVLIRGAIYLSAAGAIVSRFLSGALLPLLDGLAVVLGWLILARIPAWRGGMPEPGPFALFALAAIGSVALFGGYDRPIKLLNVVKGMAAACLAGLLVVVPAGVPAPPPALLLLVATAVTALMILWRVMLHLTRTRGYTLRDRERQRVLVVGTRSEANDTLALLWQTHFGLGWKGSIDPGDVDPGGRAIARIVRQRWIDEVVFCAKDISWQRIITWMEALPHRAVEFKLAQPDRERIIGPGSVESLQDLHVMERHAINSAAGRRAKRLADLGIALAVLITLPACIWAVRNRRRFMSTWWRVAGGSMSWVGFHPHPGGLRLPSIKRGAIDPLTAQRLEPHPLVIDRVNITYAKDYRAWDDLRYVWKGFALLGG